MKQKYYLVLNDQEHRLIIESMNQLRNKLIADGKFNVKSQHTRDCTPEEVEDMYRHLQDPLCQDVKIMIRF